MTIFNSAAYYDALSISAKLQCTFDSVAVSEIHTFAYLACLLSVYRGRAVSDWGYGFVATDNGSPYSPEIELGISGWVREGFLDEADRYVSINSSGLEMYEEVKPLLRNKKRDEFLDGSCSSALALPVGIIRSALTTDHDMQFTSQFGGARALFNEAGIEELHNAFEALSEQIGIEVKDLMVPAVVWLNYLTQTASDSPLISPQISISHG